VQQAQQQQAQQQQAQGAFAVAAMQWMCGSEQGLSTCSMASCTPWPAGPLAVCSARQQHA
jgi:hypothetical protein